ncbi:hypothetical protein C9374_000515 [Naegleria lovaniensis]|uniref:Uncharacterized protein n=1 Tax=Naegleria lovaniensis TaxID=51637 RepID=A0AA88GTY2_NAELO|nr:uncharacterized protein C9374_000515 [Naegleria lovaniensis]KAG2388351.1 hypothetical protein C9374_000515 [Naegleria lovaniensis]
MNERNGEGMEDVSNDHSLPLVRKSFHHHEISSSVHATPILSEHVKTSSASLNEYFENIKSCIGVGERCKTLLGPKALEKLFVDPQTGEVLITNDGATAIQYMKIENPIAQLFVDLSKAVDNQVGDGTTSVIVLAASMLEEALKLIRSGIHPMRIVNNYSMFNDIIEKHLTQFQSFKVDPFEENSKQLILQLVRTTLNSKFSSISFPKLADIAVDAMSTARGNRNLIQVLKLGKTTNSITFRGSSSDDTALLTNQVLLNTNFVHENEQEGMVLPSPKLALLLFELDKPKQKTSRLDEHKQIDSSQIDRLLKEEENYIKKLVIQLKKLGANMICVQENLSAGYQAGISDSAKFWLQKSKINCLKPITKNDISLLSKAFNIFPISSIEKLQEIIECDDKTEKSKYLAEIAYAKNVYIGRQIYISLGQTLKQALLTPLSFVILSASTQSSVEELERAFNDSICIVENFFKSPILVPGGGACEMSLSAYIHFLKTQQQHSPLQQLIMESYCNALESIPHVLSQGFSSELSTPSSILNELRQMYRECFEKNESSPFSGIYLSNRMAETWCQSSSPIANMKEKGIFELLHGKISQMKMALQTVQRILKIRHCFVLTTNNNDESTKH